MTVIKTNTKFLRTLFVSFLFTASVIGGLHAQNRTPFYTKETNAKVDPLLKKLSLEEKLAQIEGIRPNDIMENGKFSLEKAKKIIPYGIGHFCQFSSSLTMEPSELRDFVREVQHYLMTETKAKIPAIFHEEAITGFATQGATTFPQQIGIGCSWNPELVARNAASTARNMRAAGATYALSPMLDISRTPHWERIEESYGEDAYLTSAMGLAFVNGLQGTNIKTAVAATTKHFAGYGAQASDTKEFYEEFIMPHEVVIKNGNVKSVMPSYGKFKGSAVIASKEMLTTILREQLGFDGVVVSDYGAINLTYKGHKQAKSSMEAGVMALDAGADIELAQPISFPFLPQAIKEGLISEKRIDESVKRSLTMKARLGLLDKNPIIGADGELDFDPPANRKLAYDAACQSMVLLKNNGILPLNKNIKKIALVGPNAGNVNGMLGDYTYQSMISFWWGKAFDTNNPKLVSVLEGLTNKVSKDVTIQHERGCDWSAPLESVVKAGLGDDRLSKVKMLAIKGLPQPDLNNAVKIANESDVIIAVMGENIYLCGEGRERKGIRLPGDQEAFVQKMIDTGKPVILVLFGGRQQIVSQFEGKCAAIIQAWFPGEEGGNALSDIVLGNVNPTAKLCVSYPADESKNEINYKNGYKADNQPQYPFGFGLSYTNYTYTDLKVKPTAQITDDRIALSFKVKNTGKIDGAEIVQLYVSPADATSTMKPIQLKGFQRIELKAQEEKTVTFKVSPQQLAQYKNNQWVIEAGKYKFMAAASSTDIRLEATVDIKGATQTLKKGRSVFFALDK